MWRIMLFSFPWWKEIWWTICFCRLLLILLLQLVLLTEAAFTPGPFWSVPKQMSLFPINLHISLGSFCLHSTLSSSGPKRTHSQGLSLRPNVMSVTLCIMGECHNNNNNKSRGLIWCSEDLKWIDIWLDEHISQILDTWKRWGSQNRQRQIKEEVLNTLLSWQKHSNPWRYCPYWQAVVCRLLSGRPYRGYLFRFLSRLCSCCKRTAPGLGWNHRLL